MEGKLLKWHIQSSKEKIKSQILFLKVGNKNTDFFWWN
jgi:hypothetical protein